MFYLIARLHSYNSCSAKYAVFHFVGVNTMDSAQAAEFVFAMCHICNKEKVSALLRYKCMMCQIGRWTRVVFCLVGTVENKCWHIVIIWVSFNPFWPFKCRFYCNIVKGMSTRCTKCLEGASVPSFQHYKLLQPIASGVDTHVLTHFEKHLWMLQAPNKIWVLQSTSVNFFKYYF